MRRRVSIPYGKGKAKKQKKAISQKNVSIPYGKGKVIKDLLAVRIIILYQFPMGKVKYVSMDNIRIFYYIYQFPMGKVKTL